MRDAMRDTGWVSGQDHDGIGPGLRAMDAVVDAALDAPGEVVARRRKDAVDYEGVNAEITGDSAGESRLRSARSQALSTIAENLAVARAGLETLIGGLRTQLLDSNEVIQDLPVECRALVEQRNGALALNAQVLERELALQEENELLRRALRRTNRFAYDWNSADLRQRYGADKQVFRDLPIHHDPHEVH